KRLYVYWRVLDTKPPLSLNILIIGSFTPPIAIEGELIHDGNLAKRALAALTFSFKLSTSSSPI
ncbi:MAG: hypothetical protein ACI30O_02505, partial [Muribaculaceae bacterium]